MEQTQANMINSVIPLLRQIENVGLDSFDLDASLLQKHHPTCCWRVCVWTEEWKSSSTNEASMNTFSLIQANTSGSLSLNRESVSLLPAILHCNPWILKCEASLPSPVLMLRFSFILSAVDVVGSCERRSVQDHWSLSGGESCVTSTVSGWWYLTK